MRIGIGNSITNYASQFAGASGGAAFPDYDLGALAIGYWDAHFLEEQYSSANTYPGVVDDLVNRAENLSAGAMSRFTRVTGDVYLRQKDNTYYWERAFGARFYSTYDFPSSGTHDAFVLMRTSYSAGSVISEEDTNPYMLKWSASGAGSGASCGFVGWYVDGVYKGQFNTTQINARTPIMTGQWIIVRIDDGDFSNFFDFEVCNDTTADIALVAVIPSNTANTNLTDIMAYLEARRDILNS